MMTLEELIKIKGLGSLTSGLNDSLETKNFKLKEFIKMNPKQKTFKLGEIENLNKGIACSENFNFEALGRSEIEPNIFGKDFLKDPQKFFFDNVCDSVVGSENVAFNKILNNLTALAKELQKFRDILNSHEDFKEYGKIVITITSGFRDPLHNYSVRGSSNSQHLLGKAADFSINPKVLLIPVYNLLVKKMKKGVIKWGYTYIRPENYFIHYDIRDSKPNILYHP
jgi:hypothetical protein